MQHVLEDCDVGKLAYSLQQLYSKSEEEKNERFFFSRKLADISLALFNKVNERFYMWLDLLNRVILQHETFNFTKSKRYTNASVARIN